MGIRCIHVLEEAHVHTVHGLQDEYYKMVREVEHQIKMVIIERRHRGVQGTYGMAAVVPYMVLVLQARRIFLAMRRGKIRLVTYSMYAMVPFCLPESWQSQSDCSSDQHHV